VRRPVCWHAISVDPELPNRSNTFSPCRLEYWMARPFEGGYWQAEGKTPAATIYAAILRELQEKGEDARLRKAGRAPFALAK